MSYAVACDRSINPVAARYVVYEVALRNYVCVVESAFCGKKGKDRRRPVNEEKARELAMKICAALEAQEKAPAQDEQDDPMAELASHLIRLVPGWDEACDFSESTPDVHRCKRHNWASLEGVLCPIKRASAALKMQPPGE